MCSTILSGRWITISGSWMIWMRCFSSFRLSWTVIISKPLIIWDHVVLSHCNVRWAWDLVVTLYCSQVGLILRILIHFTECLWVLHYRLESGISGSYPLRCSPCCFKWWCVIIKQFLILSNGLNLFRTFSHFRRAFWRWFNLNCVRNVYTIDEWTADVVLVAKLIVVS